MKRINPTVVTAVITTILTLLFLGVCLFLYIGVEEAQAATSVKDAGTNLGDTMRAWAVPTFGGTAALVSTVYLVQRDFARALAFVGLALLIGGFVFAPATMGDVSESFWKTVF